MKQVTIRTLRELKRQQKRFACITSYDASFAGLACAAGIETILIGDSLGMVLQGHDSTLPVTVDDICYHVRCVRRGATTAMIIADMPFMSYASPEAAFENAGKLMRAGAHMVKLEGGEWLVDTIRQLELRGAPVCAHLGLTPQSVNSFGGYVVQGRSNEQADKILADAKALDDAGASLLVLECVPAALAEQITKAVSMPVIGIGAGAGTDGQVLVMHDLLGMSPRPARFVRNFLEGSSGIEDAFRRFGDAVRDGSFPQPEHCFE